MSGATLTYVVAPPGSGKTLWLVTEVEKLRVATGRTVYYTGIPELTLPWRPIPDVNRWSELPEGSIIVIDEAQDHFPQRNNKDPVPENVKPFDRHRHRGFIMFLATQRRTAVDHFVRGCVNRHLHLRRAFGLDAARIFEWTGRMGDETDRRSRNEATRSFFWWAKWAFWAPRTQIGTYKSTADNTVSTAIPKWKIAGILLLVAMLGHGAYTFLRGVSNFGSQPGQQVGMVGQGQRAEPPTARPALVTGEQWASRFQERIPGLPYTAQAYDAAYRIASVPRISGCMEIVTDDWNKCVCTTQQGTVIRSMSYRDCKNWIKYGQFDPTVPDAVAGGSGMSNFGAASSTSGGSGSMLATAAQAFGVK